MAVDGLNVAKLPKIKERLFHIYEAFAGGRDGLRRWELEESLRPLNIDDVFNLSEERKLGSDHVVIVFLAMISWRILILFRKVASRLQDYPKSSSRGKDIVRREADVSKRFDSVAIKYLVSHYLPPPF